MILEYIELEYGRVQWYCRDCEKTWISRRADVSHTCLAPLKALPQVACEGFREELARLAKRPWGAPEVREISSLSIGDNDWVLAMGMYDLLRERRRRLASGGFWPFFV